MNLSDLTLEELLDLQKRIPVELKRRQKKEKNALIGKVKKMVAEHGFSLEDLLDGTGEPQETGARAPVRIKYRHPKDESLTWTGRGRQSKWVEKWLADGGKLEDLEVSD